MIAALAEHRALFDDLISLEPTMALAASVLANAIRGGGKIMLCGNGGSAADAQHIAAEFVGRFSTERRPLAAIALTTDSSVLTCIGNDYGFERVFERQVRALGRPGDVLVAISTSGNSINVQRAVLTALGMGVTALGLLGCGGGSTGPLCDLALVVPSSSTARIQEAHGFLGHVLCAEVERRLGLTTRI